MNQATILNTLADNLHAFAVYARTLNNNPRDIFKALVEKKVHRLQGMLEFCSDGFAITRLRAEEIDGQVSTIGVGLEALRKARHAKNYLCGKQQAVNDAHDDVDSAIRELNQIVVELRNIAAHFANNGV